jgi:hypothetical protein
MKCIVFIALLIATSASAATTRYCSPSGSASSPGTPVAPMSQAAGQSATASGDTLYYMDGSYSAIAPTVANITLRSYNKWGAIVNSAAGHGINPSSAATGIVIDGFKVSNAGTDGIKSDADGYTIRNCWVTNAAAQGVGSHKHDNGLIEYCLVENNGLDGQLDHGIYVSGTNIVIRNNVTRYNAHYGIQLYPEDGACNQECKIYNNLVYGNAHIDNRGGGIVCWINTSSNVVVTNYFYGNTISESGPEGALSVAYGTAFITNNILLSSTFRIQALNSVVVKNGYNLSANSFEVAGLNNVVSSTANFVSTGTGRYWLVSTSPARGAALSTVYGPVDFFGNTQSSVSDIGFQQYSTTWAADVRTLDPSTSAGANYWSILTSSGNGATLKVTTARIGL